MLDSKHLIQHLFWQTGIQCISEMDKTTDLGPFSPNHSQKRSMSFSSGFAKWNVTQFLISLTVLFSQSVVCFIQTLLNLEK